MNKIKSLNTQAYHLLSDLEKEIDTFQCNEHYKEVSLSWTSIQWKSLIEEETFELILK